MSQQFYHTIPNDIDMITTTPTREGIFKYLSQIGYDKFPEFVLDILTKVDGHKAVDVTDGQGDEKLDILTINPNGERCLTQCKHTIDYTSHYNGNDLDLMVVACLRKNCKESIFVTNSDLTPQGKKYVTDNEYSRGFPNPAECPKIAYWNGLSIWEKIKNNQDIINKWFSGLGQVHGLRSFKFDLTIQKLPFDKSNKNESDAFDEYLSLLSSKPWIKVVSEGLHYEAKFSDNYEVNLKRWFQITDGLDINFISPEDDLNFFNKPLFALSIEVVINSSSGKFSPKIIQEEIVKKITDEVLLINEQSQWWHIITSQIKSIIYLHDISEPREILLTSAKTFVKTISNPTQNEYSYCSLSETDFEVTDEEEDSIWIHKNSGIQVVQMFEQKINPVEQFNYQILQQHQLKKIAAFDFFAVENIASSMIMRIRRLLYHEWMAFQYNDNTLIWAIEPSFDKEKVKFHHDKLSSIGLKILIVRKADAKRMLENFQKDIPPSTWMFTSNRAAISYPIMLNRRIFWLSKYLKLSNKIDLNVAVELLKFKYSFENKNGFDLMQGEIEQKFSSLEIKEMLFDVLTFRGKRMMDIAIFNNPISINIRYNDGFTNSSNDIVLNYIKEFDEIFEQISTLFKIE